MLVVVFEMFLDKVSKVISAFGTYHVLNRNGYRPGQGHHQGLFEELCPVWTVDCSTAATEPSCGWGQWYFAKVLSA